MRLRKFIVLGALVVFTSGMMSCAKKTDTNMTDTAATTMPATNTATPPPPPPPPPADTMMHNNMDTSMKTGSMKDMKKDVKEIKKDVKDMKKDEMKKK